MDRNKVLLLELKRNIESNIGTICFHKSGKGISKLSCRNERGEWEVVIDLVELVNSRMRAMGYDNFID